jgi:O-antigen ligase
MLCKEDKSVFVLAFLCILFGPEFFTAFYDIIPSVMLFRILYFVLSLSLFLIYVFIYRRQVLVKSLYTEEALLLCFLFFYLIRTVIDVFILNKKIDFFANNYTLLFQYLSTIFLPYICIKNLQLKHIDFHKLNVILAVLYFLFLIFSLQNIIYSFQSGEMDLTRVGANSAFDSIGFGHAGVSLLILSVSLHKASNNYLLKLPYFALSLFSIFIIFFAGSRGPVVALLVIMMIYFISKFKFHQLFIVAIFICIFFFFSEGIAEFMSSLGSDGFGRIFNSLTGNTIGNVTSGRDNIYAGCIKQISEYPLTGGGYILPWYNGGFAHNFFLEAFLATGLFGGAIFTLVLLYIICKVLYIIVKGNNYIYANSMYIFYLFIQFVVYSSLSRTMLLLPLYWVTLFLVIRLIHYNEDRGIFIKITQNL